MSRERVRHTISRLAVKRSGEIHLIAPNGLQQNWLIDLRAVFMDVESLRDIANLFWHHYAERAPFQLGAMETAGIPLLIALLMTAPPSQKLNSFIVRKERKTTGLANAIEGSIVEGIPIVFVDDIINSGASVEKARAVIEQAGHSISELFIVIDFDSRKARSWRTSNNIPVTSLFKLSEFGLALNADPPAKERRYRKLWQSITPGGYAYYVVPKSCPVLSGGRLFRGSDRGMMEAFNADTGQVEWQYQARGATVRKGIWSTPAIHDSRVYFGAYNGVAYCLDARDGSEIWVQSLCEWIGASPLVVAKHGLVYLGLEYERPWSRGTITALKMDTGLKAWEHITKAFQHGSPAYFERADLIIWGTADHQMLGLDARTGRIVWSFATRRSVKYAPAVDQDRGLVAFASFDKSIYLLDAASGERIAEWNTDEICYTTPLIVGNRLFCGSGDRHMYVVDLDTLKVIKKIDTRARVYSSPTLVGDRVIFGTCGGRVLEMNVNNLEIQAELQLHDAITNAIIVSPDGGRMYVSTYMNHLLAYERMQEQGLSAR